MLLSCHWWTLVCLVVGTTSRIFSTRPSCSDGRVHYTDTIDASGFVTRQSTFVLQSYYLSKYKHRFQCDNFGVAFVGRQSAGVDFKHHSVLILDGGATLHCVAHLTLLSNFRRDVPVVRIEGIGGIQLFSEGRRDLILDLNSNGRRVRFTIADVYYIPKNVVNLISYTYLCHQCPDVEVSQVNVGLHFAQLSVGDLQLKLVHLADLVVFPMWSFQKLQPDIYSDNKVSPVFTATSTLDGITPSHGDQLSAHVHARNALRLPSIRAVSLRQLHLIRGHEPVPKLLEGLRTGRIVGFRVIDLRTARDFSREKLVHLAVVFVSPYRNYPDLVPCVHSIVYFTTLLVLNVFMVFAASYILRF
jgi:hypothetical protein